MILFKDSIKAITKIYEEVTQLKQMGVTTASVMLQNKLEYQANQNRSMNVGDSKGSMHSTYNTAHKSQQNPENIFVFKESSTEKLALSLEMLKQLKGGIPTNQSLWNANKKQNRQKKYVALYICFFKA